MYSSSETSVVIVGILLWLRRDEEDVGVAIIDRIGLDVVICGIYTGPKMSYRGSSKNSIIGTSYMCLLSQRVSEE